MGSGSVRSHLREECCGCGVCAAACPHQAISMKADGMGFPYPAVDPDSCVECGICREVCAFKPVSSGVAPEAEAVRFPQYLDESQSGGLAYALMRQAVLRGSVVYGAAMDGNHQVRHRRVDTLEGLVPLRLSKYVQSDMTGIPEQVLSDLGEGRSVLFTGTPCQCAGMASLCAGLRDRLVLADIVCHGVPSPGVWAGFLKWYETRQGSPVIRACFRDPARGWHHTDTRLEFASGEVVHSRRFYHLFIHDLVNRPSCGSCPFARVLRPSDLTMGDCWGVEKVLPGFADDQRGCSLLLVNTPAGRRFLDGLSPEGDRIPLALESVMQPSLREASHRPPLADRVEKVFVRRGFGAVDARFGVDSPGERFRRLLHQLNPTHTKLYRRLFK